jgi:hypothetical protein
VARFGQLELEDVAIAGQLQRVDVVRQVGVVEVGGVVGGVGVLRIGQPQARPVDAQEAHEAVVELVEVARAADDGANFAPLGCVRHRPAIDHRRHQVGDQIAGHKQVDFAPQHERRVVEGHDLHPAALVLHRGHHTGEVAVARHQQHPVEVLRLQQHVYGQIEIGVGLGIGLAVLVLIPAHFLDDDLIAKVAQQRVEAMGVLVVDGVGARPVGVEADVGVEAHQLSAVAAGEFAQHVIAHPIAAVAIHIGGVDVDADAGDGAVVLHNGCHYTHYLLESDEHKPTPAT